MPRISVRTNRFPCVGCGIKRWIWNWKLERAVTYVYCSTPGWVQLHNAFDDVTYYGSDNYLRQSVHQTARQQAKAQVLSTATFRACHINQTTTARSTNSGYPEGTCSMPHGDSTITRP